jgi:hypothetical protein
MAQKNDQIGRIKNSKPVPHIPLPFEEVMKDVLKMKLPKKETKQHPRRQGKVGRKK